MTTVLEQPERTSAAAVPPRRVVRALASREARWIVRHPLFLLGLVASGVLVWKTTAWMHTPVLHRDDARLAGCLLPLAAATMIVCNLAAFRARRHGTEDIEDAAPTTRSRRTAAHLTAFAAPVLVAVLFAAAYVVFLYALGGIWRPSPQELATGPAIVALAAAAGVALGWWIPSPISGPLGVLAFAAFQTGASSLNGEIQGIWFAPFVDGGNENRIPEFVFRQAGWHLVYLLGLAGIFAAVASLRHGRRPRRIAALAIALSSAIVGGVMQARPIERAELAAMAALVKNPGSGQVCETRATVRYCVFPAYRELIDRWDRTVRRVLEPVPPAERAQITIRQAVDAGEVSYLEEEHAQTGKGGESAPLSYFETTDDIVLRPAWARGADERGASFDLALAVARRAIGTSERRVAEERRYAPEDIAFFEKGKSWPGIENNDAMPAVGDPYTQVGTCWTAGQAREAIALWLATRAFPGSEAALRYMLPESFNVTVTAEGDGVIVEPKTSNEGFTQQGVTFTWNSFFVSWSVEGIRTALELTSRPSEATIARALAREWDSWVRPETPLERLRLGLGMPIRPIATPDLSRPPGLEHLGYPEFGPPMSQPPACA